MVKQRKTHLAVFIPILIKPLFLPLAARLNRCNSIILCLLLMLGQIQTNCRFFSGWIRNQLYDPHSPGWDTRPDNFCGSTTKRQLYRLHIAVQYIVHNRCHCLTRKRHWIPKWYCWFSIFVHWHRSVEFDPAYERYAYGRTCFTISIKRSGCVIILSNRNEITPFMGHHVITELSRI